jgi:hypothetical protein
VSLKRFARKNEQERLAIRGQMDWGQYGRDALQGGLAGGAGGMIVGGPEAAAVGAAAGAVGYLGKDALEGLAYSMKSTQQKAAWQAGDLQDKMAKIGDLVKDTAPQLSTFINHLGSSYKEFVDAAINGSSADITKNRFNLSAEQQRSKYLQESGVIEGLMQGRAQQYESQQPRVGLAQTADTSTDASTTPTDPSASSASDTSALINPTTPKPDNNQIGDDGYVSANPSQNTSKATDYSGNPIPEMAATLGGGLMDEGVRKIFNVPAGGGWAGKLGNPISMVTGIATDFAVNGLADHLEKLGGDLNYIKSYTSDIYQIVREVNRLTNNDERVREAGNQVFSYLQNLQRYYTQAQEAAQQQANQQGNTQAPPQGTPQDTLSLAM